MVYKNCEYCGKEKGYQCKSLVKKYCSHECANKASSQQRTKKRTQLICEYCGNSFELLDSAIRARENRGDKIQFCSYKCSGLAHRTRKVIKCKNCGNEFETTRNKFCSRKCVNEYRKKTGIAKRDGYWFENGYKVLYQEDGSSIKEHIKVMQDFIGRKLKTNEVVHHINGNKLDNRIENLQLMKRGEHSRLHRNQELREGKKLFSN